MAKLNQEHPPRAEINFTGRVAICRCWQSKKFPFCDGSHNAFNQEHSENLGPMIINKDE